MLPTTCLCGLLRTFDCTDYLLPVFTTVGFYSCLYYVVPHAHCPLPRSSVTYSPRWFLLLPHTYPIPLRLPHRYYPCTYLTFVLDALLPDYLPFCSHLFVAGWCYDPTDPTLSVIYCAPHDALYFVRLPDIVTRLPVVIPATGPHPVWMTLCRPGPHYPHPIDLVVVIRV